MNIFVLDRDPELAAKYHCDKHVCKMILEGKIEMNNDDTQHNLWERLKAYESKFRVIDADSTIAVTFSKTMI